MPLPHLVIYSASTSPRLVYVLDWLLSERLGFTYTLTQDLYVAASARHCIAYGHVAGAINIAASELLFETEIRMHSIHSHSWRGLHALYFDDNAGHDIPFDMLSGIFYLLTRFEEYLQKNKDTHGRFPYAESILAIDGVLERPVVDEWVEYLRQLMADRWNISIPKPTYIFEPTYDIDIAWAYRNKGLKRLLGAAIRDVLTLKADKIAARFAVPDPYDAFDSMLQLHRDTGIKAHYFILAAEQPSPFDKNISPHHPAMAALIRKLSGTAMIGMHPSYYSGEHPELLKAEKNTLEAITGKPIHTSRQHYIRLSFPNTYRTLIANGITDDYSMGYSTHTGFRAGTSHSFLWYDLKNEHTAALRIHPFCFMDTTAHYDLQLSTRKSFEKLATLEKTLRRTGGKLTTVFHNFSLGSDKEWHGWRQEYEQLFLQK